MRTFSKKDFKKEIIKNYGSVFKLKKHLKKIAINEYDCLLSEVEVYNCRVAYTSNPNCFASFIVKIGHVGCTSSYALDKQSRTKAGINRGCTSFML